MARNGLEQGDVADFFGITQQAVSQWMVKEDVPVKHRKKLSSILGIDVEKIIENNHSPTTTQTASGNGIQQVNGVVSGNMAMFDRDSITCAGLDDRHPPSPGIDADEWAELLYWLRRHPTMMRRVLEEARKMGLDMDEAANR